ncbi:MAG: hypothetical protein PHN39_00995 [Candidatus Pacebacteria bacterium]|nr:hypothetical protein [Candidatus Paceibacterota bacterium]
MNLFIVFLLVGLLGGCGFHTYTAIDKSCNDAVLFSSSDIHTASSYVRDVDEYVVNGRMVQNSVHTSDYHSYSDGNHSYYSSTDYHITSVNTGENQIHNVNPGSSDRIGDCAVRGRKPEETRRNVKSSLTQVREAAPKINIQTEKKGYTEVSSEQGKEVKSENIRTDISKSVQGNESGGTKTRRVEKREISNDASKAPAKDDKDQEKDQSSRKRVRSKNKD